VTEPRRVIIDADYAAGGIWWVDTKEERELGAQDPGRLLTHIQQPGGPPMRMPPLTPGLRDDLKAWNQSWEARDEFWNDAKARLEWEDQGRELAIRVQDELGPDGWEVLYWMNGRVHRVHPPGSWSAYTWRQDLLGYTHPDPRERAEEEAQVLEHLRMYQDEIGEDSAPTSEP